MKTKILIGEDNLVTQQVLKSMLETKNCQVTVAGNSDSLIKAFRQDQYSFLLLDYHLDQDAEIILDSLKNLSSYDNTVQVYIMSAGKEDEVMKKLRPFNIKGFLKKPIELNQLHELFAEKSNNLESIMGDNPERIQAVNKTFLAEVPPALKAIETHLSSKEYSKVKKIVHRIRPAFTYVDRDDILEKMEAWEADLEDGSNKENYKNLLQYITEETEKLVATFTHLPLSEKECQVQTPDINEDQLVGINILIVDDNQVILSVFTSLLQIHKAKIAIAKNGNEGVAKVLSDNPDIILMDIHMPVMDGVDAIKAIRSKGIKTPILAISNAASKKDDAISAGANTFLLKPIDSMELIQSIRSALNL